MLVTRSSRQNMTGSMRAGKISQIKADRSVGTWARAEKRKGLSSCIQSNRDRIPAQAGISLKNSWRPVRSRPAGRGKLQQQGKLSDITSIKKIRSSEVLLLSLFSRHVLVILKPLYPGMQSVQAAFASFFRICFIASVLQFSDGWA